MAKNTGNGKFYQDKRNGPWRIDTRININGKYYHIQKRGFATKHEAQAAYDSIVQAKIEEVVAQGKRQSNLLFEQFVEEFIQYRSNDICESTAKTNDFFLLKNYFHPFFDGKAVCEVFCPEVFLSWYKEITRDTRISKGRCNRAIYLAKNMLKFAYGKKYIGAEAYQDCDIDCRRVKEPNRKTKERVFWNDAQKAAFIAVIDKDTMDYVMFSLFIETAPRIGEFLGLTADCFGYDKDGQYCVNIKQQVEYGHDGTWHLTDRLKSHESYRSITLSNFIAALIQRYIEALGIKKGEFLFGPYGGHTIPLSRTEFRRRITKYSKTAGIPDINPHAFRHMRETALVCECNSAADVQAVATMMGHSMLVSMNIYQHNASTKRMKSIVEKTANSTIAVA